MEGKVGPAKRTKFQVIALLMDRGLRAEILERLPAKVKERSALKELSREYSLSEIAVITRAGPARILGLDRKGHLGPGADADVTIYAPDDDRRRMFALPRYVIKGGEIVVDDGELGDDGLLQRSHASRVATTPDSCAGPYFEEPMATNDATTRPRPATVTALMRPCSPPPASR